MGIVTVGMSSRKPKITNRRMNFHAQRNHLSYGIRLTPNTAIRTPEVGVSRLVKPSPNWKAITVVCLESQISSEKGAMIGMVKAALALPDGINRLISV